MFKNNREVADALEQKELLVKLCEEGAEVIQSACKTIHYGPDGKWDNGLVNTEHLALEIGNLQAVINGLRATGLVKDSVIAEGQRRMEEKLPNVLRHFKGLVNRG